MAINNATNQKLGIDDRITTEELALFSDNIDKIWEKSPEHEEIHRKLKTIVDKLEFVANACKDRASDEALFVKASKNALDQATPKKFRHYLLVRLYPRNKYEKLVQYWFSLRGDRGDNKTFKERNLSFRLVLGIPDEGSSKKIRRKEVEIVKEFDLESSLKVDGEILLSDLATWFVNSLGRFKKTYQQMCEALQPELESLYQKKIGSDFTVDDAPALGREPGEEVVSLGVSESSGKVQIETGKSKAKNLIYYGPPGTGKTFRLITLLKKDYGGNDLVLDATTKLHARYAFVTFHQSYGYEEFVEGLRPKLNDSDGNDIQYEIKSGIFKQLCEEARKPENKDERFAMIIDEINRGNISRIFGELITLIETDKRGHKHKVTLPYSQELFWVPDNVDIIGTMNTADRSLALLDTALRRRFDFEALYPDTRAEPDPVDPFSAPLAGLEIRGIDVRRMLETINHRIEVLYDRDHCIGHAYLTGLKSVPEAKQFKKIGEIFRKNILPLLEEYFFEDRSKIRLVLGDNQKKDENLQFTEALGSKEQSLEDLFGASHELDSESVKQRYGWRDSAFGKPEAYIGIYSAQSA
jgi:hypothetical protein